MCEGEETALTEMTMISFSFIESGNTPASSWSLGELQKIEFKMREKLQKKSKDEMFVGRNLIRERMLLLVFEDKLPLAQQTLPTSIHFKRVLP